MILKAWSTFHYFHDYRYKDLICVCQSTKLKHYRLSNTKIVISKVIFSCAKLMPKNYFNLYCAYKILKHSYILNCRYDFNIKKRKFRKLRICVWFFWFLDIFSCGQFNPILPWLHAVEVWLLLVFLWTALKNLTWAEFDCAQCTSTPSRTLRMVMYNTMPRVMTVPRSLHIKNPWKTCWVVWCFFQFNLFLNMSEMFLRGCYAINQQSLHLFNSQLKLKNLW